MTSQGVAGGLGLPGLAALVLGFALAGCGGGGSERDRVLRVVERYSTAVDHRFFAEQCRLMTPARRAGEIRRAGGAGTCVEALEVLGGNVPRARVFQTDQEGAFDDLARATVTISGDRAQVTELNVPALADRVVLEKRGDSWLVAEAG